MDYSTSCKYSIRLIEKLKSLDTDGVLDFEVISKAISFAKKYHHGQLRKSGEPFYSHPLEVAYIISDYNLKTDVIAASILHDTVEDTEVTLNMIRSNFNNRIAQLIEKVTRVKDPLTGYKPTVWDKIIEAWRDGDDEANLIKSCDRQHNLSTLQHMLPAKQQEIINETIDYFFYTTSIEVGNKIVSLCFANGKGSINNDSEKFFYLQNFSEDSFQLLSRVFQSD
jgi:(p)ppGpp synthase/HD superfamily hydrolase